MSSKSRKLHDGLTELDRADFSALLLQTLAHLGLGHAQGEGLGHVTLDGVQVVALFSCQRKTVSVALRSRPAFEECVRYARRDYGN